MRNQNSNLCIDRITEINVICSGIVKYMDQLVQNLGKLKVQLKLNVYDFHLGEEYFNLNNQSFDNSIK
jgi:hypothetical protein